LDADELRKLQAPIKQRYKDDPAAALIPARAVGEVRVDNITCTVEQTVAGLHVAAGGDGTTKCSADMLLEALVACAGVTLKSVATVLGVEMRSARVIADGHWDARGTLGVSREAPVGMTDVTLSFEIDSDADPAKLDKLIQLTERYCVIYQTLKQPPGLATRRV
jgi:uncharacterized OsmC-like protein